VQPYFQDGNTFVPGDRFGGRSTSPPDRGNPADRRSGHFDDGNVIF